MHKSLCIKSNNINSINYILDELDNLNLDGVYFSCRKFKNFTNVIIHFKGMSYFCFIASLSEILSYLVLDLYENEILKRLVTSDYFYFSPSEQKIILDSCIQSLNYEDSLTRFELLETTFYKYLSENKAINLKGFIDFRLFDYIKYLDNIVDICVNKFIIDKEYVEFVNLLKSYISSSDTNSQNIHLIYRNKESILLDENKNIIPANSNIFRANYLSDISFSSNDYALNSLLTLIPNNLHIHLLDIEDEFINTLKLIFDTRVHICTDCDICRLYKKSNLINKL